MRRSFQYKATCLSFFFSDWNIRQKTRTFSHFHIFGDVGHLSVRYYSGLSHAGLFHAWSSTNRRFFFPLFLSEVRKFTKSYSWLRLLKKKKERKKENKKKDIVIFVFYFVHFAVPLQHGLSQSRLQMVCSFFFFDTFLFYSLFKFGVHPLHKK